MLARHGIGVPLVVIAGLAGAWLALGAVVTNSYYLLILTLVPIWAVMGLSWNLLSGYTGLISFGHAAFFGLGAYTVTLALVKFDVTPWLGIPLGMLVGALAGILIGYPTFRLRGHYFALAMLAYPMALLYIFDWAGYQEVALPMKRVAPARFMQFSDYRIYVALAVALLVASLLVSLAVERTRFGMALLAIKQNEPAAEAAGLDTWRWKMRAITLSGAIAAAAGGFYAVVLLVVTPDSVFGILTSAQALVVALFGGVGTLWGPVIGAAVLIPLGETAAPVSFVKPMRAGGLAKYGLKLVVDETYTPPLSDATPLIAKIRTARPDFLWAVSTNVPDDTVIFQKLTEMGIGPDKMPIVGNGAHLGAPELLKTAGADVMDDTLITVANWALKGQEDLIERFKKRTGEPWMTQDSMSDYGHIWIIKEALEAAGVADRHKVAEAVRAMDTDTGAAKYFAGGHLKFDAKGRRVDAPLVIVQWQHGRPVTVYPPASAAAKTIWVVRQ